MKKMGTLGIATVFMLMLSVLTDGAAVFNIAKYGAAPNSLITKVSSII